MCQVLLHPLGGGTWYQYTSTIRKETITPKLERLVQFLLLQFYNVVPPLANQGLGFIGEAMLVAPAQSPNFVD